MAVQTGFMMQMGMWLLCTLFGPVPWNQYNGVLSLLASGLYCPGLAAFIAPPLEKHTHTLIKGGGDRQCTRVTVSTALCFSFSSASMLWQLSPVISSSVDVNDPY